MSARHRSVLRVGALAAALAVTTLLAPTRADAQDPSFGTTLPGAEDPSSTVAGTDVAPAGTSVDDTAVEDTNQSVVSAPAPVETALFTESRKIMAIIGALVCVALMLALLTVRYVRRTKPYYVEGSAVADDADAGASPDDGDDRSEVDADAAVAPAAVTQPVGVDPVPSVEVPIAEPPSADHHGADRDWEPRTDEHQRIEPRVGGVARPSSAARRAVLGGGTEGGDAPVASDHG